MKTPSISSFSANMRTTNQGISYFTQMRDHYIRKSEEVRGEYAKGVYKAKAETFTRCIERVIERKFKAIAALN